MRENSSVPACRGGFTLLELVVTLLLMAILSTAFIPLVRMMQQRSAESVVSVKRMYELQNQMERLVQAFATETEAGGSANSFSGKVNALLVSGMTLEENQLVEVVDDELVNDAGGTLLLVSVRSADGYRLRRLFGSQ